MRFTLPPAADMPDKIRIARPIVSPPLTLMRAMSDVRIASSTFSTLFRLAMGLHWWSYGSSGIGGTPTAATAPAAESSARRRSHSLCAIRRGVACVFSSAYGAVSLAGVCAGASRRSPNLCGVDSSACAPPNTLEMEYRPLFSFDLARVAAASSAAARFSASMSASTSYMHEFGSLFAAGARGDDGWPRCGGS